MKRIIAALIIAALAMTTSLVFAGSAFAQTLDKVVKVGSLGDQSGLYADIGGARPPPPPPIAVECFRVLAQGAKIDLISPPPPNHPPLPPPTRQHPRHSPKTP